MFLLYYLMLINLYMIASESIKNEKRCNTLYYGLMDKIMLNSQSLTKKLVLENLYKKRSKQSGMSVNEIKNCYNSKIKNNIRKK
jgi:hypothetical protein